MADSKPNFTTLLHMLTTKLSSSNFVIWKRQVQTVLRPYGLFGYLDGSKPCPPLPSMPSSTDISTPGAPGADSKATYECAKAAYDDWIEVDQQLCGLLFSTLSEEAMGELPDECTSRQIWEILHSTYQNKNMDAAQPAEDVCLKAVRYKLSMLSKDSVNYGSICIYKVPENYRNRKSEAYTPRLVSIGFIHGSDQQAMEEYKIKYLNNFLHTFRVSLEELVKYAREQQSLVCRCYEDTYIRSLPEGKDPSEVILLDGVFVVQLLLKNYFVELREKGDLIFDSHLVSNDVLHDMLLFENQLPLGFLRSFYDKFVLPKVGNWFDSRAVLPPSFTELAHRYFKDVGNTRKVWAEREFGGTGARHFVECLSVLHKPDGEEHAMPDQAERGVNFAKCPTATGLKAAGVKFERATGNCFSFDRKNGVLKIPALTVSDSTETFYYNLLAFEQSGNYQKHITSHIIMLGNLMKTPGDVSLLCDHHIIRNELGSIEKVAQLFGNLYKDLVVYQEEFRFGSICFHLKEYRRNPWYRLKAEFYSLTPTVQAIGAIALLEIALTLGQTVCSVLQFITSPTPTHG